VKSEEKKKNIFEKIFGYEKLVGFTLHVYP
jgi:hypothetical protein